MVPNSNPGDPTKAQVGDIVTWGNDTNDIHQPWPTVDNKPDGDPVPDTSNPPGSALYFSDPVAAADRPGRNMWCRRQFRSRHLQAPSWRQVR